MHWTEIHADLAAVRCEAGALASCVSELEKGTNHWADEATSLEIKLKNLIKQVASLSEKCGDLEGRSRRNNSRIIGLREGTEGPTDFITDLLKDAQCPFIVRVHYFRVKEDIMQCARQAGPLLYNGQRFLLFPDYTTAVVRRRAAFDEAKKLLRDLQGVKYGLLFPAWLRITHNST